MHAGLRTGDGPTGQKGDHMTEREGLQYVFIIHRNLHIVRGALIDDVIYFPFEFLFSTGFHAVQEEIEAVVRGPCIFLFMYQQYPLSPHEDLQ